MGGRAQRRPRRTGRVRGPDTRFDGRLRAEHPRSPRTAIRAGGYAKRFLDTDRSSSAPQRHPQCGGDRFPPLLVSGRQPTRLQPRTIPRGPRMPILYGVSFRGIVVREEKSSAQRSRPARTDDGLIPDLLGDRQSSSGRTRVVARYPLRRMVRTLRDSQEVPRNRCFPLRAIRERSTCPLDMSSVSVQFSKAVETIIAERVLLPFRAWYGAHRRWSGPCLERDLRNHLLRRFASFIDGPRRRTPDLGVFLFVLNLVRENRMRRSPSLRAFREFARRVDDPDFLLWNADLTNVLREITTRYRKGAAHTEPQSFEMTHDFMRLLFGGAPPDRSADTNCFLQRLVQATSISGGS